MIFPVKNVPNHGIYELHDAIDFFFTEGLDKSSFDSGCFPKKFEPVFSACFTLRDKAQAVWTPLSKNASDRRAVKRIWKSHNCISDICENTRKQIYEGKIGTGTKKAIKDLFNYMYEDLLNTDIFRTEYGSIHDHYKAFYGTGMVCPFCGFVGLKLPSEGRSDYDHYLCRKHYPCLAVNFGNLIPMCKSCNSPPQKGSKNVLRDGKRRRRPAYVLFTNVGGVTAKMTWETQPSLKKSDRLGKCSVQLKPVDSTEQRKFETWLDVFNMQSRSEDRVKYGWRQWMIDFLDTKDYPAAPNNDTLRADCATESTKLLRKLSTHPMALLKSCFFAYVSTDATDAELEGYKYLVTYGRQLPNRFAT